MSTNNQPDFTGSAYASMQQAWQTVSDVAGGTDAMRAAGEKYLPREKGEHVDDHKSRVARSVFFNAYAKTRDALVGMVFRHDPELQSDVSEEIKGHWEDIDLAGNHGDVFTKELFVDACEGHAAILVDMPSALPDGATKEDEIVSGRRPYWVRYKANQILNWRTARINGETQLTQITFEERTCEAAGEFGEEEVTRYRVFRLSDSGVEWVLYRKDTSKPADQQFVIDDQGRSSLRRIPVAIVYGQRTGYLTSSPPLLDLAHLNISHWQQYSDFLTQLHWLVPTLVLKGRPTDQQKIPVGANAVLDLPAEQHADAKYISHDGQALEAASKALLDLEQRMAMMGLSMLSQRQDSNVTATEKRQDWVEQSSQLATMARSLQDGIELALQFHAEYLGADSGGSVKLGVDEGGLTLDGSVITALSNLVGRGQLTLETMLQVLQRMLPGVDLEEEIKRIEKVGAFRGGPPNPNELSAMQQGVTQILGLN